MNTPQPPNPAASSASPAPKKERSKAEKLIVRGGIVLLLVLVAIQAHARFGYDKSLKDILAVKEAAQARGDDMTISEVPALISGFPIVTTTKDENGVVTSDYRWYGAGTSYGFKMSHDTRAPFEKDGKEYYFALGPITDDSEDADDPEEYEMREVQTVDESLEGGDEEEMQAETETETETGE